MVFFIGDREQNRATGESEGIECAHFIGDTNAPLLTVLQLPSLSLYSNLFISVATLLLLLSMKCGLEHKKMNFSNLGLSNSVVSEGHKNRKGGKGPESQNVL